ncbi:MAG: hypothetical protein QM820_29650 [Minicystis sp.]
MNTMILSSFVARLARPARRLQTLLGLAAALAVPAALFGNSCSSDFDYQQCLLKEQRGNYLFEKDNLCGCERLKCDLGTTCFHGDCCEPALHDKDHDRCGCTATCKDVEVCRSGQCCDPTSEAASTRTNCGCEGRCGDREDCQKDPATGRYTCVCDAKLSLTDPDNCGCSGTPCDPDTERCRNGQCECDPLAGPTQQDDANCACRGECPFVMENGEKVRTAYCYGGVCHCFSADEVICDGECKKESDCTCEPQKHMSDVTNCACNGPCKAGDSCVGGACTCDNLAHAGDNADCGCSGTACDVAKGEQCEQGTCVCPPAMLSNNLNCGCSGTACNVAKGEQCEQGTCVCPPAMLSNNLNCGCSGTACNVAKGEQCEQGICSCPPAMLSNNLNCGCSGTACNVDDGLVCSGGVCVCPPERQTDPLHCGCPATVCGEGGICVDGVCGQCVPVGGDLTIRPINKVPGSGDCEFEGHGPFVTVTVHIVFDPAAHMIEIVACADMIETAQDFTHGAGCVTRTIANVPGSKLVSREDFVVKYTDNNWDLDDAIGKATSRLENPAVIGVTCIGDHEHHDICPDCCGEGCSGCTVQFGCVVIAP